MSKKKGWLCLIKRLFFFPETHHHQQQKKGKRKGWFVGWFKRTKGLPSLAAPLSLQPALMQKTELGEEENQSKFEEDVQDSIFRCEEEEKTSTEIITNEAKLDPLNLQHEIHVEILAATKIQTVYRGYLARKALRALKGFVRLQAIIRGRAVRRQAMTTLKCLQSIAKIQSEVCARRCQLIQGKYRDLQLQNLRTEKPKAQCRLDDSLLAKEEEIDIILRKKEAILRRKRTKAYLFNYRNSTDSDDRNAEGRLRYWLDQYVNDEVPKKEEKFGVKQPKLKNIEGLNGYNTISLPRRSFHNHRKQDSYAEDNLHPISPTSLPAYMAATQSARAKTRSMSSPRLRPVHFEVHSDGDSPYKHKLSPMSSVNSEATCSGFSKVSNKSSYSSSQQKSPSLKGISGPVRSSRNLKVDCNLDYERLLVNGESR